MDLFVNLLGLLLMGFIVWWFWIWKPPKAAQLNQGIIDIVVTDGVYQPAQIELPLGIKSTLRFTRKDPSPCAAMVIIDGCDIAEELPLGHPKEIVLTPTESGSYPFHCQMNMYKGMIKVIA